MSSRVVSVKLLLDTVAAALRDHDDLFESVIETIKDDAKKAFSDLLEEIFTAGTIDTNCVALVVALALFFRQRFDVRLEELFSL